MGVQISLHVSHFISFGYVSRNGIVISYDSSIFDFSENPPILFSTVVILVYFLTKSAVAFAPQPHLLYF